MKNPAFDFNHTTKQEIKDIIENINTSKANPVFSIPSKIIKTNSEFFADLLYNNFNNCIDAGIFPNNLKLADLTPGHKKW